MAAGFAVARLGGPSALFIDAASFWLMGPLVLTLPTITREPRFAQPAAANRWLGFGALFSLRYVPALTLLSLVFFFSYGPLEVALPVYSVQTLHANADGYGLLWTGFPSAFPPVLPALPSYPAALGPATSPASLPVRSSFQNCYASRSISLFTVIATLECVDHW